jgi:hypothetical protein
MRFLVLLCIIISITSCRSRLESFLINDIEKDGLSGNVKLIEVYAYKDILIEKPDTAKQGIDGWTIGREINEYSSIDTIFEILLSKTIYNQKGNRIENIEYQSDNILATWNYLTPDNYYDIGHYRSKPQVINEKIFQHLKYNYNNDNVLESILSLNFDGSFKSKTEFHFFTLKRKIIDSTFFDNRGLSNTTTRRLTKYGISEPDWISNNSGYQFDSKHKIIIAGEIHYYYDEYDKYGNWIKVTKFYKGQTKENPVYLRRVIEYY